MGCGYHSLACHRFVTPNWRLQSSGVEPRKRAPAKPRDLPKLTASNTRTVPGARLRALHGGPSVAPTSTASGAGHGHPVPRASTSCDGLLHVLYEGGIAESAIAEGVYEGGDLLANSSGLADANFVHMLSSDLACGSEIADRRVPRVLPRTLPDKLDWAHEKYKQLWINPKPFPYGGLSSKQMIAVDDLGAAGGRSINVSASMPSLAASHASRFEPSLEHPSRSLRDYHAPGSASTASIAACRWDPPAPSSLATSKMPDLKDSRFGVRSSLAMSKRAVLRDKHAFLGKSC
mmetsp:Transcript_11062/g.28329  ORF Transcript_11062/g.28329 Transcript_11062/m.28329 type:complete len:290 (+) Transcript_11062:3-872(+)